MSRMGRRAIALLLGIVVAAAVAAAAVAFMYPVLWIAVQPEWTHQATMPLIGLAPDATCPGVPGSLQIISEATRDHVDPLVESAIQDDGRVLRAKYSGHWAETRVVVFVVGERSVTIRASFDTDHGLFPGSVAARESRVHRHADEICFDLSVRRLDGSSIRERWIGSVLLR